MFGERGRLREFAEWMISEIPCEDRARAHLRTLPFDRVLLAYLTYTAHLVPPRKRRVHIMDGALTTPRARARSAGIASVIAEIMSGVNIRGRLSETVESKRYAAPRMRRGKVLRDWESKDLGVMAYSAHHLHLHDHKPAERTTELLFVRFFRDAAVLLCVGDHNSFDDGTLAEAAAKFQLAHRGPLVGVTPGAPFEKMNKVPRLGGNLALNIGGFAVPSGAITMSGHGLDIIRMAGCVLHQLSEFEAKIESGALDHEFPGDTSRRDFHWFFEDGDLVLCESESMTKTVVYEGPT